VFSIEGNGAYSRLKFESGVHRVQRVPVTEANGRVHTSTVTVAVLPEAEEIDVEINPNDLRIDTYRASGAGGQHITNRFGHKNNTLAYRAGCLLPGPEVPAQEQGKSDESAKVQAL